LTVITTQDHEGPAEMSDTVGPTELGPGSPMARSSSRAHGSNLQPEAARPPERSAASGDSEDSRATQLGLFTVD